jgi:hypothetical protein
LTEPAVDLRDEWRTPINFYGRVEDEKGAPVPDADVDLGWNNLAGSLSKRTKSDAQGRFQLEAEQGKYLEVSVNKDGFYSSQTNRRGFFYAGRNENFIGIPTNPVIFRLRRKAAGERLLSCDFPGFGRVVQLRRDGTPLDIDLARCEIGAPGTGQLRLEFNGTQIEKTTRKFDWDLRLSVLGGGLVESEEEFNFEAPETGYQPAVEISMPSSAEDWQSEVRRKYFVRLKDGRYGRFELRLLARNGVYKIISYINPSGSRQLEFDPDAQPKKGPIE